MTTKVKIELLQKHQPVIVEVNGTTKATLVEPGETYEDYVHSNATITVREMTTGEVHERDPR